MDILFKYFKRLRGHAFVTNALTQKLIFLVFLAGAYTISAICIFTVDNIPTKYLKTL